MDQDNIKRCICTLLCALTLTTTLLWSATARALSTTESADQVLSALAEVIKDRTKLVASQALRQNILDQLCEGTLKVTVKDGSKLTLRMGGSQECRSNPNEADVCDADDQFVDSCTVLDTLQAPLTDPTFLKRFGRDALRFGFRLSGATYAAAEYESLNLGDLSNFVYELLDVLSRQDVSPSDVATPLSAFADRLADGRTVQELQAIASIPEAKSLLEALPPMFATVTADIANFTCTQFAKAPAEFRDHFPALAQNVALTPADGKPPTQCAAAAKPTFQWLRSVDGTPATCNAFSRDDLTAARQQFLELFFNDGAPFAAALQKDCSAVPADGVKGCNAAMVAMRLYPALAKAKCATSTASGKDLSRDLRNMHQLFGSAIDRASVELALQGRTATAAGEWRSLAGKAQRQLATSTSVGPYELAGALRLTAGLLQAFEAQPAAVEKWLETLGTELEAQLGSGVFDPVLLPSLAWAKRHTLSVPLQSVRDAFVTMVLLPRLQVVLNSPDAGTRYQEAVTQIAAAVRDLADFARAQTKPGAKGAALRRFAKLLRAQAAIVNATSDIEPRAAKRLATFSNFLKTGAAVTEHVADEDWVGVSVIVADEATAALKSRADLASISQSLAFSRVLLNAYQAKNKEDAKAVFEGALEDVASRERRFERWTVDITALVAGRGGVQRKSDDTRGFYGMYAPVGPQLAYKYFGAMIYPVDVGAYLVDSGADPEPSEALRFGTSIYTRVSASVPFVFGVGGDYRPGIEDEPEAWRAHGFIALELPLYMIH
jgi:hypothetical protein